MFKNITILALVVVVIMLLTSNIVSLPNNITIPSIQYGSVESKLLKVVQQIETDKQQEQAMVKVNDIIEILKQ